MIERTLKQLEADYLESVDDLKRAWVVVNEKYGDDPEIARLGAALDRYVTVQIALKSLADGVLKEWLKRPA